MSAKNGKSHGNDGLTKEFFGEVAPLLIQSLNFHCRGVINIAETGCYHIN